MFKRQILSFAFVLSFITFGGFGPAVNVSNAKPQALTHKKSKAKSSEGKLGIVYYATGQPVLWKERAHIENLNLLYGQGGQEGAPNLSDKFTFVDRDKKGSSFKIYVKDSEDKEWTVKFGKEARPETSATRIVWAMGYHTDDDYFVRSVHIDGFGDAQNVRFKRRHNGFKELGYWTWERNPFNGTREFDGFKVLMAVLNNWDLKYVNNKILRPDEKHGGNQNERIYYVSDLGSCFAKTGALARTLHIPGDWPAGSKDQPERYARESFITGVDKGAVRFHYKGKDQRALKGIPIENARWMGMMLGRLSEKQLGDAFRAGGYTDSETVLLVHAMQQRIAQLQNLR